MDVHSGNPINCSIAFAWCNDCHCMHVALFDADHVMVGMGSIPDIDELMAVLQFAKGKQGERPTRLQ